MLLGHRLSFSRPLCGPRISPNPPGAHYQMIEARRAEGRHSPWRPFCYGAAKRTQATKMAVANAGEKLAPAEFPVVSGAGGVRPSWRKFGNHITVTKENTTLFASDRDMFVFLA